MDAVHALLETVAQWVDMGGLLIIGLGTAKFVLAFVAIEARRLAGRECTLQIQAARRVLGGYILVALEFMIVSDVIASVMSRSLESLTYLAGIVAVRTAIGYFLERELESTSTAGETT